MSLASQYAQQPYSRHGTLDDLINDMPDVDRPYAKEAVQLADELMPSMDRGSQLYSDCVLGIRSYIHDIAVKGRHRDARNVLSRGRTELRGLVDKLRRYKAEKSPRCNGS